MNWPMTSDNDHRTELGSSEATRVFTAGSSRIELHFEDCFQGMGKLPEECVDVVVTSPPYNIGVAYGTYDDTVSRKDYLDWIGKWSDEVWRVLARTGSLFLNIGGKPSDPWGPVEVALRLRERFRLQNTIHWIKSIVIEKSTCGDDHGLGEDVNVGHIKPINSKRYLSDAHEYVFHFTKHGDVELDRKAVGVAYKDKSNIARWQSAGTDARCRGNTWFIPYKTIVSRERDRPHPASFPPRLAEMCVKLHGLDRVNLVVDPFMGLGNTALACVALDKSFLGYEIDPEYFGAGCEQIARAVSQLNLFR